MEYLGKDIPKLGFGLMRLPMLGEEVDLDQADGGQVPGGRLHLF